MAEDRRTILIVDDEAAQRELLAEFVGSLGFAWTTAASAEAALETIRRELPAMVLLDVRLPGMSGIEALDEIRNIAGDLPVLLITAFADLRQAVEAMKHGADDYLAKPIDLDELAAAITDAIGRPDVGPVAARPVVADLPEKIVCVSPPMRHLIETAAVVAPSTAPVLITGESGTGKEVVAELMHRWSGRAKGPFVVANCAGWSESLIESELFGHVKGAFTGASTARPGLFRAAAGGTLFLDEIGELPLHLQPKLLRALESRQITPVGSEAVIEVDTRLVAATNRDLEAAIGEGKFREDLYYRINVIELHVPPLRDRREDILPLAKQFATEFAGAPVRLSPQAAQCLLIHSWAGNVRQLRNAIQRACLLCRGDVILPEHLPSPLTRSLDATDGAENRGRLSQVERATILATLEECGGNRTRTAEKLGISRRALIYKLRAIESEDGSTA